MPEPTIDQIMTQMSEGMNGRLPEALVLAAETFPEMVIRHAEDSAFAMPREGGALDETTRTLIYLGVALATNSEACVEAMMNRAKALDIGKDTILETYKIARFAEATRVFGNAETLFRHLEDEWQ